MGQDERRSLEVSILAWSVGVMLGTDGERDGVMGAIQYGAVGSRGRKDRCPDIFQAAGCNGVISTGTRSP